MKRGTYKTSDWWSYGVFLYEMLSGRRPNCSCNKKTNEWCPFGQKRSMEENALKEDGVLKLDITYPPEEFPAEARDLLEKLFIVDPKQRLGARGVEEIKAHPFFSGIDWQKLAALETPPPFIPDGRTVNAQSIGEVGEFNKGKFKKMKLTEEDEKLYEGFDYVSDDGIQAEIVMALQRMEIPQDTGSTGGKSDASGTTAAAGDPSKSEAGGTCCIIV
jgi:serine/threonine protein kinase